MYLVEVFGMVNITNKLIDKKVNNIRFFLNYPEIELQNESEEVGKFASFVNEFIKNDVSIFEEVVISTLKEEFIIGNINVISEFQRAFNKNNIISIPVEFSQIIGLTDISHISSYNYDFNLMEKITLDTLFKEEVDFERVIQNYIMEEIYDILDKYKGYIGYDIYDLMSESIYICEDPVFYFNDRNLVICISSFELTSRVCNLIEFSICFKKIKNILSDYAIQNIVSS
ncbi:MAG: hypothetical protein MR593_04510 [Intestinibacter sp.]|uniref:hypothetical protein n=1 Tax=Intestinibacter sp. TaxID=1965304 RepID=UPI0025BB66F6|nr:hypothetical protein [Intestinibacter sp.]MCI6737367.1 hypothetical protein [Intestinibacter sp.]